MIDIRQIHEHLADVIEVPPELRNRKTEVIFLAMDSPPRNSGTEEPESPAPDNNHQSAVEFFGSILLRKCRSQQSPYRKRADNWCSDCRNRFIKR